MATTEVRPDPKKGGKSKSRSSSRSRSNAKTSSAKSQAAKSQTAAQPPKEATTPKAKAVKPGMPTKHPANLSKSQHQPPKGQKVTDAMVKRAREEWGIEPPVKDDKWVVLRPGSRGHIVHAALTANAERTLCETPTNWVGGATVVEDKGELNCLWCMTRIASFGK